MPREHPMFLRVNKRELRDQITGQCDERGAVLEPNDLGRLPCRFYVTAYFPVHEDGLDQGAGRVQSLFACVCVSSGTIDKSGVVAQIRILDRNVDKAPYGTCVCVCKSIILRMAWRPEESPVGLFYYRRGDVMSV